MSRSLAIADALVTKLNSNVFDPPFVAERQYLPRFDLKEADGLAVYVVPRGAETSKVSRSTWQHLLTIDLAVQKKLANYNTSTQDALVGLVEAIREYLQDNRPAVVEPLMTITIQRLWDPDLLADHKLFTSVLSLTFLSET